MTDRRVISGASQASDSSEAASTTSSAADRTDLMLQQFHLTDCPTDHTALLRRFLSVNSVMSTSSSFARRHQRAAKSPLRLPYTLIGQGFTGMVYEVPGEDKVVKKAIAAGLQDNLWNDFQTGYKVGAAFTATGVTLGLLDKLPRIPKYLEYYPTHDERFKDIWESVVDRFPGGRHTAQMSFMQMERVLPLPKPMRDALIELYAPEGGKDEAKEMQGNKDAIMRLYLGRLRQSRASRFFSLKNFPLHLNQALEICPEDVDRFAREMATALAVFHWCCQLDAFDIEFVLASAPLHNTADVRDATMMLEGPTLVSQEALNYRRRTVHLWIIDFDKVKPITLDSKGVKNAIYAAEENDPYYPKPVADRESREYALWRTFGDAYLEASYKIIAWKKLHKCNHLPAEFLKGWENYRKEKLKNSSDDKRQPSSKEEQTPKK